jgi:hypothetical protein
METIFFYAPLHLVEIESLRDSGLIAIDRARIVPGAHYEKCLSRADFLWSLGNAIPVVPIGEEQSVLIAVFVKASPLPREDGPLQASGKVCFEAKDCHALIPLTPTSGEINAGRFPNFMLQTAVFATLLEERDLAAKQDDRLRGALEMISILCIPDGSIDLSLAHNFHHSKNRSKSLVSKILAYQRHAPAPREPISGLRDLRVILRESLPNPKDLNPPLQRLSDWGQQKWEKTKGLLQVFVDPELQACLRGIDEHWHLPFKAAALGIFLHWRELYLRNGSLDLDAYFEDCRQLVDATGGQVVAEALWLLGYSAGFSSFSQSYYERLETPNVFARSRKAINRLPLHKLDELCQPPEPLEVKATVQDSEIQNADVIEETAKIEDGTIGPVVSVGESKDLAVAGNAENDEAETPKSIQANDLPVVSQANQSPPESAVEIAGEKPHSPDSSASPPIPDIPEGLMEPVIAKKSTTKKRSTTKNSASTPEHQEGDKTKNEESPPTEDLFPKE